MRSLFRVMCLLVLGLSSAGAEKLVVIVDSPQALEAATQQALRPWGIEISSVASDTTAPHESMPGARDRARELCKTHSARAVVWLSKNQDGEALWLYDQESDRVIVRKLTVQLPLSDAEAAAIALSIKTLLMHSTTAPAEHRFGASSVLPTPLGTTPIIQDQWFAQSTAGLRFGGALGARLGLGILHQHERVSLGISLTTGPGRSINESRFGGSFGDGTLALKARLGHNWRGLRWLAGADLELHITRLRGSLVEEGESVKQTRLNPSIGPTLGVEKLWPSARLGFEGHTRYYTRNQRYLVNGTPVLTLPTTELELRVYLSLPL